MKRGHKEGPPVEKAAGISRPRFRIPAVTRLDPSSEWTTADDVCDFSL